VWIIKSTQHSLTRSRDLDMLLADRKKLAALEMYIWQIMQPVSWKDKVTNINVLQKLDKTRCILDTFLCRKHSWVGHVLRHDGLLQNILEEKMIGKPTRGRKRLNIHSDFAENALKRRNEERKVWQKLKRTGSQIGYLLRIKVDYLNKNKRKNKHT